MTTKVTERDNEALAPSSFFSFLHNLSSCITVIVVVKTIIIPRKREESNISILIEAPKKKIIDLNGHCLLGGVGGWIL